MKLRKTYRTIKLYSGECVTVDIEDFEKLNNYKWFLFKTEKWQYAIRKEHEKGKQKTIYMHREIMGVTDPKVYVDHKDHDGLNNRKRNLRVSNNRLNQYNVAKKSSSRQKYKNIRQLKSSKWQVRVRTPNGKRIERTVNTEKEAVKLYNELVIKYHGEFAYLQEYLDT